MAGLSLDKGFVGLYKQKYCQFELKRMEVRQNEERLWDFMNLTGLDESAIQLEHLLFFKTKKKLSKGDSDIIRATALVSTDQIASDKGLRTGTIMQSSGPGLP